MKQVEIPKARELKVRQLTPALLERINIGKLYWEVTLTDIEEDSALFKTLLEYIRRLDEMIRKGIGLFLWGDNSTGKTHALAIVMKAMAERGLSAYVIPADELKAQFIESEPFDGEMTKLERVRTVQVLGIEDVGKEYSASEFAQTNFENLMRIRRKNLLVTHFTTNLSTATFAERYGKSVTELLKECSHALQVKGTNFRVGKQKEIKGMFE